ncbi:MAG: imelysin family protein [Agriterribacter sp.]
MKKTTNVILVLLASAGVIMSSCKKDEDNGTTDTTALKTLILQNVANKVCLDSYQDLWSKTNDLLYAVNSLITSTTDDNLSKCRTLWKSSRETWERSEAWLFGPVDVDKIDPRIDTWPVDFNDLNTVLASSDVLDEAYIDALDEEHDALKGFHPIEYLLWGVNGNKKAADLTDREKEYLLALAQNLAKLANEVKTSWSGGYAIALETAGNSGNTDFPTKRVAFETIVDAMGGICDEVANGKMKDPFEAQDPQLEESPFAQNSITDFTNNIKGIMDIYQGKFTEDGKGIEDLVRTYNLSLDNDIKTKHGTAVAALQAITVPFGEAILTQQTQVQTAMDKINELAETLADNLKPFVQQYGQ